MMHLVIPGRSEAEEKRAQPSCFRKGWIPFPVLRAAGDDREQQS